MIQLAKLGALTPEKYRLPFPNSRSEPTGSMPIFFEYAQDWLNSLQIEDSTRKNYRSTMQTYWVPHLATYPLDKITPVLMRKIVNGITWTSPIRRNGAVRLVTGLLTQAVNDELILRNPANSIPPTSVTKREIDPFSRDEADKLITKLYEVTSGLQAIYAFFLSCLSIQECVQARRRPCGGARLIRARGAPRCAASGCTARSKRGPKRRPRGKFY